MIVSMTCGERGKPTAMGVGRLKLPKRRRKEGKGCHSSSWEYKEGRGGRDSMNVHPWIIGFIAWRVAHVYIKG